MRIVNREEFLKLPNNTLYSRFKPAYFSGLEVKLDTIYHNGKPIDFIFSSLIGNVDSCSSGEEDDILDNAVYNKKSFDLDFDHSVRDGMFDDEQMFAVYENSEITAFILKLKKCIK